MLVKDRLVSYCKMVDELKDKYINISTFALKFSFQVDETLVDY